MPGHSSRFAACLRKPTRAEPMATSLRCLRVRFVFAFVALRACLRVSASPRLNPPLGFPSPSRQGRSPWQRSLHLCVESVFFFLLPLFAQQQQMPHAGYAYRSEEHTSELQSPMYL